MLIISLRPGNFSLNEASLQGARICKSGARAEKVSSNLHWSFPLPVAPWATALAPNSLGHLDLRLGDKRAGDRGAEKVLGFVNGIPPNHRINEIVGKLIHQVDSPVGGGPGGEGFFLETLQFFLLSDIRRSR